MCLFVGSGERLAYKGVYHCTFNNVPTYLEGCHKEMGDVNLHLQLVPPFLYPLKRQNETKR